MAEKTLKSNPISDYLKKRQSEKPPKEEKRSRKEERERFKKRFYRCVHPAAREKRRLRAVGRDELCALAQRAHRLHVLFGKAAVQRAVVPEHGVDHNDGILPRKVAEEIFCKMHLLHRAEKAHADAVEFDLKLSPVRGKGLHLVRHIAHDVAAEAVRRVRR